MKALPVAILALALAGPPLLAFDPYALYILGAAFRWAALASAWSLLAFAGQISFGHAVYFGAGAYASALLSQRAGWSPWLAVAVAAGVGAAVAVPIGLTAQRLAGAYLALATFAYAEGGRLIALNWTALTGGGAGLIGIPVLPALPGLPLELTRDRAGGYYLALGLLLLALGAFAGLRRTRVGLAWAAIRESRQRAQLLGVNPAPYTLLAFACSGALTAAGGALYAHAVRFIEPDLVFGRALSLLPLIMAVFGGVHALLGPATGALLLYLVSEVVLQPVLPRLHQLPYAAALILAVLVFPKGLAGLVRRA
jgi:branched-chain amino acid transport system permease protein